MKDKQQEVVETYFKVLLCIFPGGIREKHEKLQSGLWTEILNLAPPEFE